MSKAYWIICTIVTVLLLGSGALTVLGIIVGVITLIAIPAKKRKDELEAENNNIKTENAVLKERLKCKSDNSD